MQLQQQLTTPLKHDYICSQAIPLIRTFEKELQFQNLGIQCIASPKKLIFLTQTSMGNTFLIFYHKRKMFSFFPMKVQTRREKKTCIFLPGQAKDGIAQSTWEIPLTHLDLKFPHFYAQATTPYIFPVMVLKQKAMPTSIIV